LGVLFPFPLGRTGSKISSINVLFYIDGLRRGVWVISFSSNGFISHVLNNWIILLEPGGDGF